MRVDIRDDVRTWPGDLYNTFVIDRRTGRKINLVIAADDATGQVVRYEEDQDGHPVVRGKGFFGQTLYLPTVSEIRDIEIVEERSK